LESLGVPYNRTVLIYHKFNQIWLLEDTPLDEGESGTMRKYPPRSGNYFYTYANEELLNLKMVELTEMNPSDEISLES
jgi:hypothetical protein